MRIPRVLILALLAPTLAAMICASVPTASAAVCCAWEVTTTYYSNPEKTMFVGKCYSNACTNESSCTGPTSQYFDRVRECCEWCP